MTRVCVTALFVLTVSVLDSLASGIDVKGRVRDSETGEYITGATIYVMENPSTGTSSGLDGSFSLKVPSISTDCHLICSMIGYKEHCIEIFQSGNQAVYEKSLELEVEFILEVDAELLEGVTVTGYAGSLRTETAARQIEKNSVNMVNVMSAAAMQVSPDITVANVIRRMSGVNIERNSSGEGQYAILRGMDKRYNYTLVNGIKIPSPDNRNRFVPLDMFPSEMLDRLEVSKSMTAEMEGDGIGGAVNLVMKDAPSERQFTANLSTGYNALYFCRDFQSFDFRSIAQKSPYEANGMPEDYAVTADDFTMKNLHVSSGTPLPDLSASISYGDRIAKEKLGIMLAASYSNSYRGKNSDLYYQPGTTHNGTEYRFYSEQIQRMGVHAKLDYAINPSNRIAWYNAYMDIRNAQTRDSRDEKEGSVRLKWNRQYIANSTLEGSHGLLNGEALKIRWSFTTSYACNQTPDNVEIFMQGNHISTSGAATRRWEHNSDRDIAGYISLDYTLVTGRNQTLELSAGGMYRDKFRDSFFNEYTFNSATGPSDPQIYGEDWYNFDEIDIVPLPYGNIGDPLNYTATEKIGAAYAMMEYTLPRWSITAGIRMEHTDQGYVLDYPRNVDPEGNQNYYDFLPDLHVKYEVHRHANLRFSYARAINRPSFFEIVPYSIINEDYKEKGNPDLKHTVADNIDLRYEYFPASSEQFMAGIFYKRIENPIEYGLFNSGQDTYYMPMNFGTASNMGVEVDILKYFNWIGIKANYTYTHSEITTGKYVMDGNDIKTVMQTRPLFGQAAHVANLSVLVKDAAHGIEGQIAAGYTGKRLSDISNWYNDDIWEDGYFQLDISAEKSFRSGLSIYAKASNLLNSPVVRYIAAGPHTDSVQDVERIHGAIVERREWHGQSFMIGLRYSLK